jgi:PAS domain S-box-containing protein
MMHCGYITGVWQIRGYLKQKRFCFYSHGNVKSMKLRQILIVLSLLAFLSAMIGGYLYYASMKKIAFKEAERQAVSRILAVQNSLSALLSRNIGPVRTMAGLPAMQELIETGSSEARGRANAVLDYFKRTLDVDVCYLMEKSGITIASSNREDPESFVGKNFNFRPYFQTAIKGHSAIHLALGITSGKRGAYSSFPVYSKNGKQPVGVAVIKASVQFVERELGPSHDEIVVVTDPMGMVFISNNKQWLYQPLWKLGTEDLLELSRSRQFGGGPWKWLGFEKTDLDKAVDRGGVNYLMHRIELENIPGWHVVHLRSRKEIARTVYDPFIQLTGTIVLALCVLIGLSVLFLYKKASREILQRQTAESALRESEARYRSLYHNTPAMLHSIDHQGELVSVSNHWAEEMGYTPSEIVGRKLTDFFTEKSKKYAEETVFVDFFKTGYCKDIPYRFVKKSGEIIDVLLSAIADRDRKGNIKRTLAVSIDVTARKRAEENLRKTKEELSLHFRDLERQVAKRSREITSILTYTPDVVYIKDRAHRYILINKRYEELFEMTNETVRGKSDYEILPKEVADQFNVNDRRVLTENSSLKVEELISHSDGIHTYLSVKFPIYDAKGLISGVCSISTDITSEKKARERLRRLSGSILESQEKERSAIARELHDELGQVLTALRMDTVWMYERLKKSDPVASQRALTMSGLIDRNIEDVRGMALRLRPGVLDDLGLIDALEWYTSDFEERTKITCIFEHSSVPRLKGTVATAAYRITQEALTNVARHSGASNVDVFLSVQNSILLLTIKDAGRGFDPGSLSESEGLGLVGMRERSGLAGGKLTIHSAHGKGTTVSLDIPMGDR